MELIELLNTRGITYKKTNNPVEILLSCTSGEHEDNTPSFLKNKLSMALYIEACMIRKGYAQKGIKEWIRVKLS